MDQVINYSYIEYPIQKIEVLREGIANPEITYNVSEIPDSPIDVHRFNEQYVFYHDSKKSVELFGFGYFKKIQARQFEDYRQFDMGSKYLDIKRRRGYRYFYQLNTNTNMYLVSGMDKQELWSTHFPTRRCLMQYRHVQDCPDHIRLQDKLLDNGKDGFVLMKGDLKEEFYINVDNLVLRESVYIEW